jgi:toxin HigB-1
VIESFRHKGLRLLFENGDVSKLNSEHLARIRLILSALSSASRIEDMNRPAFRLHPLKGDLKGLWSVTVRANWRIIFRFSEGRASGVDLIDYH